jgi:uncharacterized RDD family membrane protein YckC
MTGGDGEGIITPEAVVLDLAPAGVASRLFSGLIDALAQLAIYIVLVLVILVGTGAAGGDGQVQQAALGIALFGVIFGYPIVSEMIWKGRSLGKAALGLRVVTVEGAPIRFRHAALRAMGGLVDKWVPPGGVVGLSFVLGTPDRQRIGDLLAGTIVILDPIRSPLPTGVWFPVPPGFEAYAATIDPTALTVDQYTVIRSFLIRARELTPPARASVATDLASRTAGTLRHSRPADVHPETFLLCVMARYQRRAFPSRQPSSWTSR